MPVTGFDHVAIPTRDPEAMLGFYRALGFTTPSYRQWLEQGVPFFSIGFGDQKINVHAPALWQSEEFTLRGPGAEPGCGDFCFVWDGGMAALRETLRRAGAAIEAGPVELQGGRDGGRARGTSLYVRDPDRNLHEFLVYDD